MNSETRKWSFALFRITLGLNFTFHGVNRILGGLNNFREWIVVKFENTFLPLFLVDIFASVLPMFELVIGFFLLLGLFSRYALYSGALLIALLMTGSCILGEWDMVGQQMIYAIAFYLLLNNYDHNSFALDKI